MKDYFPKIQDRLRRKGYPQVRTAQETIFSAAGPTVLQQQRWHLHDTNRSQGIIVGENFVVFQTTAYSVFEEFVERLGLAVDAVASEVKGLFIERIGLRYVNLIRGEDWRRFVRPGLHGVQSTVLVGDSQRQLHQSVANTANGTMILRLFQNREGQVLPPDLVDDDLRTPVSPPQNVLLTLLDLDHFSARNADYTKGYVDGAIWHLHDDLDRVFRDGVVTDEALKVWA